MNPEQIKNALLGLLGTSGPIASFLVQVLGYPSEKVTVTLNLVAALTPTLWLAIALYRSRIKGQVQAVASLPPDQVRAALEQIPDAAKVQIAAAVPDVARIVVRPTATNGLAAAVADQAQPKVVPESARSTAASILSVVAMAGLLLATAGGLAACASAGADTRSSAERALATVDQAYAVATAGTAIYLLLPDCGIVKPGLPCSDAAVVARIGEARDVLDVALERARAAIVAAPDASATSAGIRIALDAVTIYAQVVQSFGVKSG